MPGPAPTPTQVAQLATRLWRASGARTPTWKGFTQDLLNNPTLDLLPTGMVSGPTKAALRSLPHGQRLGSVASSLYRKAPSMLRRIFDEDDYAQMAALAYEKAKVASKGGKGASTSTDYAAGALPRRTLDEIASEAHEAQGIVHPSKDRVVPRMEELDAPLTLGGGTQADVLRSPTQSALEHMTSSERLDALRSAIAKLPEKQRAATEAILSETSGTLSQPMYFQYHQAIKTLRKDPKLRALATTQGK